MLVSTLHTRTPHPPNTTILFEDRQTAVRVCVEIKSGKGDPAQALISKLALPCIEPPWEAAVGLTSPYDCNFDLRMFHSEEIGSRGGQVPN